MFILIILSILTLITLGTLGASLATRGDFPPGIPAAFGAVTVALTLFLSMTTVDARSVGIQTSFGRYTDTLDPGLQFVAPWSSVEEFTTRLQTVDMEGKESVSVTYKGGGSGRVDATSRWAISSQQGPNGAKALWEKYRDFDTVTATLVNREARDAVINVANDYVPNDARTKQDEIGTAVKERMAERLRPYGIVVDSVSILAVGLDPRTQASLDKIVAAQNDVERAKADNERAKIDGETARLREQTGSLTPEALTRYCLEVVNAWDVSKNGALPATFDCGLGSGQTPVIVGGR